MKKILIAALVLLSCRSFAQDGGITINNNTDYQVRIVLYAQLPTTISGSGCGLVVSNPIILQCSGCSLGPYTYTATTVSDFALSPGWASTPTSVVWAPYSRFVATDFQWTYAEVSLMNPCSDVKYVGDAGIGCSGYTTPNSWTCFFSRSLAWSPASGSAMTNVTLNIN